ncbi:MAG: putative toxin-antitoxin system toxin component, PIN family [Nanoarchaeota archaeon]
MRSVLDTNIFISSLFWFGPPHTIIEKALDRKMDIFVSIDILREIETVLKNKFGIAEDMIQRYINLIMSYALIVTPVHIGNIVKDDSKDNMILECAVACDADVIISGDHHLLDLKECNRIKIIAAKDFLALFFKDEPEAA